MKSGDLRSITIVLSPGGSTTVRDWSGGDAAEVLCTGDAAGRYGTGGGKAWDGSGRYSGVGRGGGVASWALSRRGGWVSFSSIFLEVLTT